MKKVLENRATDDEKKLIRLAEELKEALKVATKSDEIFKKHNTLQLSAIVDVLIYQRETGFISFESSHRKR